MILKKVRRLMAELEKVRKQPGPEAEKRAGELAIEIAHTIPQRILKGALRHPSEIRKFLHPQDVSQHPLSL
jgi:hypothetical protein